MKENYFNQDKLILNIKEDAKQNILNLKLIEDDDILEFYDMPILFYLTGEKMSFIVYWIGSDKDKDKYFMIESDKHQLNAYKENNIDLRTFLSAKHCFLLENNFKKQRVIVSEADMNVYKKIISMIDQGLKHNED